MNPVSLVDAATDEADPSSLSTFVGAPTSRPATIVVVLRAWGSPTLAVGGALLWASSIGHIHPYVAGPIGLLPQLSARWWLGLALVLSSLVVELCRDAPRPAAMVTATAALALVLHGTLPAAEPVPRFSAAYELGGFAQYIQQHGRTLPNLDARMSWPGMLSAAGLLGGAMGVPALWFARWAPLIFNLAYLVPIKAIANVTLRTSRAQWAALSVFLVANWIDQDYFSPQAVGLLLFLVLLAIVIRTFPSTATQPSPVRRLVESSWYRTGTERIRRLARLPAAEGGEQAPDIDLPASRAALMGISLLLVLAMIVSHEFTPLALCVVLFCLALFGRTVLRWLWLFALVGVFAWFSWEGETYWSGHLSAIFGNIGNAGALIGSGLTSRVQSASGAHLFVQWSRLLATAITGLAAVVGFYTLWRRGRTYWTLALFVVSPSVIAVGVNYGGEVFLRILLFSLAPCAILIAGLIDTSRPRWPSVACFVAVIALLVALFPLTRYGNESFEAIPPGDVAAAQWIHAHVRAGATVWVLNTNSPIEEYFVGRFSVAVLPGSGPEPRSFTAGSWLYLSRSQDPYAVSRQELGPNDWINRLATRLAHTGSARIVHRTDTAYVLRMTASGSRFARVQSELH